MVLGLVKRLAGIILASLVLLGSSFFLVGCQDPPAASLERAKKALEHASNMGAIKYAENTYRSAEQLVQQGWMEMARQQGRLGPFRNFKPADSILNLAYETANRATEEAGTFVRNSETLIQAERATLKSELAEWKEGLNGALSRNKVEHYWNAAELAYRTSEILLNNREYDEAREMVAQGKESLKKMAEMITAYDNDEASKIHIWRRWVAETVESSHASGNYAIIVDKSKHRTYLVKGGKLLHTYESEFGYNPAHQKMFSGDGATPEGKYYITEEKGYGRSKYYKALLINYPNASDKVRFEENKRKGHISKRARIGGLIEIHGEGGKGRDWTEGCVALTNIDMDHLMKYVGVGTPVTIVRRSDRWP